jgi:hypothetical protein
VSLLRKNNGLEDKADSVMNGRSQIGTDLKRGKAQNEKPSAANGTVLEADWIKPNLIGESVDTLTR